MSIGIEPEEAPVDETALSDEELLVNFLFRLRLQEIDPFLREHGISTSPIKEERRARVLSALQAGDLPRDAVIAHLDAVEPWAAQQVVLYETAAHLAKPWATADGARRALAGSGCEDLLGGQARVTLPSADLEVVGIAHAPGKTLTVTAVHRREFTQRRPELDQLAPLPGEAGELILRAYVRRVSRGLVTLRWNLLQGVASLHVSRLPSAGPTYEETIDEFTELLAAWLPLADFEHLPIGRAVRRLYEEAATNQAEARLQRLGVRSPGGRLIQVRAPDAGGSVLGEFDAEMGAIVAHTHGRSGNFYWLPSAASGHQSPLTEEVHVAILAREHRVDFPTPNPQDVVTHVLRRIRALS